MSPQYYTVVIPADFKQCRKCLCIKPVADFNRCSSRKDGLQKKCKQCFAQLSAARYAKNPQMHRDRNKQYYVDHRDSLLGKARECYASDTDASERHRWRWREWASVNKDKRTEADRMYRQRPDIRAKRAARQRVWAEQHPDYIQFTRANYDKDASRKRASAWAKAHPERQRIKAVIQKHKRRTAEGRFTASDTHALWIAQEGKCYYCHAPISSDFRNLEHMTPIARGGTNWPHNLCWACPPCNFRKSTLTAEEFIARYHLTPLGSPTPCQAGSPVQLSYWPFGCD